MVLVYSNETSISGNGVMVYFFLMDFSFAETKTKMTLKKDTQHFLRFFSWILWPNQRYTFENYFRKFKSSSSNMMWVTVE
mmetsp:Transcript_18129/g.41304  ORF Transcript_18129/g.41304 Transcript_18129/m.41304 type:complete len:80 (+) Transcript_18129:1327-1566(+)